MDFRDAQCPLCSATPVRYHVDEINLQFLRAHSNEGNLNEIISLSKIIWTQIPELKHSSESKKTIEELSKIMLENVQKQVNETLRPIQIFTESLPKTLEKLPESVRFDLMNRFSELQEVLSKEFETLRSYAPTSKDLSEAIQVIGDRLENITEKNIGQIEKELTTKFKETLNKTGFPEPEQMKLLTFLVPAVLPLLQELLRFQKVPEEKGRRGEQELLTELEDYYPEDDFKSIGTPGDTDILAIPKHNGTLSHHKIIIESKKNNSRWNKSFTDEVFRHMEKRGEHFAILAVERMPRGANGFLFEESSKGFVLVTSRKDVCIAYGALRSVIAGVHSFRTNIADVFANEKIEDAIKDASKYQEYLRKIRIKASRMIAGARDIIQMSDDLDSCLRKCLKELQNQIKEASKKSANGLPKECSILQ